MLERAFIRNRIENQARRVQKASAFVALLLDLGSVADRVTEIVQLGAPDRTLADDLEAGNPGGVDREYALHTLSVSHTAQRDCRGDAVSSLGDHDALESLDTLFVTFDDLHISLNGVTDVNALAFRNVVPEILLAEFFNRDFLLFCVFCICCFINTCI